MSSQGWMRYRRALGSSLARNSRSTSAQSGRNSVPYSCPFVRPLPATPLSRPLATSSTPRSTVSASSGPSSSYNSINPDEIQHFSRLSSQWWDPHGEFGLLHRMNSPRIEYIRQKVALDPDAEPPWTFEGRHEDQARQEVRGTGRWLTGKQCLDIGCGGGLLSEVSCTRFVCTMRRD